MAERHTVDVEVVGSRPIRHPDDQTPRRAELLGVLSTFLVIGYMGSRAKPVRSPVSDHPMPQTINVLFLAAEAEPYVKIGGLGDVAGSLPRALRALPEEVTGGQKVDVRLVLPLHPILREDGLRRVATFSILRGGSEIEVEVQEGSLNGLPVYFIGGEPVRRSGSVYSADPRLDAEKYVFFSLAALGLPRHINWAPDILHANDWHAAITLYASLTRQWESATRHVQSVLTVHNLGFIGPDVGELLEAYGYKLAQTDLPDWARVKPLPLGLWASDAIVAVSPTYAREMLTTEHGNGLEEFLQVRRDSLRGILNGLDTTSFDPSEDPALGVTYNAETLDQRRSNKGVLQERLGLPREPDVPLMGVVSRMDPQKGIDLIVRALKSKRMKEERWQAIILGTGDPKIEKTILKLQEECRDRVRVETRYDPGLARQIYGGADLFLMPSRYEPCGLSQMIAMRYGCIPLVRAVGGLNDTVQHGQTGFVFQDAKPSALVAAMRAALRVYTDIPAWREMQVAGMAQDFSWSNSARQYFELYQSLMVRSKVS